MHTYSLRTGINKGTGPRLGRNIFMDDVCIYAKHQQIEYQKHINTRRKGFPAEAYILISQRAFRIFALFIHIRIRFMDTVIDPMCIYIGTYTVFQYVK